MNPVTPEAWADRLSGPPIINVDDVGRRAGRLRRWRGTDADMSQPPLDHHLVVLHLGGSKRVTRIGDGRTSTTEVEEGAVTVVPAGTRYEWRTEGPIDFAHLYIHPARLRYVIADFIDADPSKTALADSVGATDPLISQVISAMLAATEPDRQNRLYLDALFDCVVAGLVRNHTAAGASRRFADHALAPARLRRVLAFTETSLAKPISLDTLAGAAGLSRFHFSRAFRSSMGEPPLAYVARRRIEAAQRLLLDTKMSLSVIALRTGFSTPSHFSERFRRHAGMTPSQYRLQT